MRRGKVEPAPRQSRGDCYSVSGRKEVCAQKAEEAGESDELSLSREGCSGKGCTASKQVESHTHVYEMVTVKEQFQKEKKKKEGKKKDKNHSLGKGKVKGIAISRNAEK